MNRALLVLGCLASLAACAGSPRFPAQPANSPTLRVAVRQPFIDFDPLRGSYYQYAQLGALLFDGLTTIDDHGAIQPGLAHSWSLLPDGRTYRFFLRTNVHFHDGTRFTGRDVVRAWTSGLRRTAASQTHPWMLDAIDGADEFADGGATTVRGLTLRNDSVLDVTLQRRRASFLATLALAEASVPAAASTALQPIGTGPWRWVRGTPTSDELWLARNADYWTTPALDSLVLRLVPDSLLIPAFDAGWIDYAFELPITLQSTLASRPQVGFVRSDPATLVRIELNSRQPLFNDIRVRKAVSQAIDTREIARNLARNDGVAANGPVPPSLLGNEESAEAAYPFDPIAARALLKTANVPPTTVLHLYAPPGDSPEYSLRLLPLIRDYLVAVGLHVEIHVLPTTDAYQRWGNGPHDDMILDTWYPDYADPDTYLARYRTDVGKAGGSAVPVFDTTADRIIDASRAATDPVQRLTLVRRANARIIANAPDVFLWFHRVLAAYTLRLAGWSASPYSMRFDRVRLAGGS